MLWLQGTEFFSAIRNSLYAYPILLALHVVALAFFAGTILFAGFIDESRNTLRIPKRVGLALVTISGALLFGAKAADYANNPWFWTKLALLAFLLAAGPLLRRVKGKALTLFLWAGVICASRGPATIKDIMHSMVDPNADFLFKSVQQIADDHGVREKAPQTDAEWNDVRAHVAVLLEVPSLLVADGRKAAAPKYRSKNPAVESEPEEVQQLLNADRPGFLRRAQRLRDAAAVAMKAVDAKDKDALSRSLDGIDKACESCHLHYWYPHDKRAQEAAKEAGLTD